MIDLKRLCAVQVSGDQSRCGHCGITWDTNDADPPVCGDRAIAGLNGRLVSRLDEVELMMLGIAIARGVATTERARVWSPILRVRLLPPVPPV